MWQQLMWETTWAVPLALAAPWQLMHQVIHDIQQYSQPQQQAYTIYVGEWAVAHPQQILPMLIK